MQGTDNNCRRHMNMLRVVKVHEGFVPEAISGEGVLLALFTLPLTIVLL